MTRSTSGTGSAAPRRKRESVRTRPTKQVRLSRTERERLFLEAERRFDVKRFLADLARTSVVMLAVAGCAGGTAPRRCYTQGDTLGWITQFRNDSIVQRDAITAREAFCLGGAQ